jgi:hypothetical protein
LEEYRHLLRTARPDQLERAHSQAFTNMSPAQRHTVARALAAAGEIPVNNSPLALAKSAVRLESRQPGALEQVFGGFPGVDQQPLITSVVAGVVGLAMYPWVLGGSGGDLGPLGGGGPGLLGGG